MITQAEAFCIVLGMLIGCGALIFIQELMKVEEN
jgi:hypothetical protein